MIRWRLHHGTIFYFKTPYCMTLTYWKLCHVHVHHVIWQQCDVGSKNVRFGGGRIMTIILMWSTPWLTIGMIGMLIAKGKKSKLKNGLFWVFFGILWFNSWILCWLTLKKLTTSRNDQKNKFSYKTIGAVKKLPCQWASCPDVTWWLGATSRAFAHP